MTRKLPKKEAEETARYYLERVRIPDQAAPIGALVPDPATERPNPFPRVFGYHELFHAFTLIGVGLHFAAISVALR